MGCFKSALEFLRTNALEKLESTGQAVLEASHREEEGSDSFLEASVRSCSYESSLEIQEYTETRFQNKLLANQLD